MQYTECPTSGILLRTMMSFCSIILGFRDTMICGYCVALVYYFLYKSNRHTIASNDLETANRKSREMGNLKLVSMSNTFQQSNPSCFQSRETLRNDIRSRLKLLVLLMFHEDNYLGMCRTYKTFKVLIFFS